MQKPGDFQCSIKNSEHIEQVHSLCVDSRPGDRLRLAKGPGLPQCQAQSEAHGPPSAMAVRKRVQVEKGAEK